MSGLDQSIVPCESRCRFGDVRRNAIDSQCLDHALTSAEATRFETDGFLVVPNALDDATRLRLIEIIDRIDAVERKRLDLGVSGRLHHRDFLNEDPLFLDLLDWPTTFPKIWGILGWHIQLYLHHLNVTPGEPRPAEIPPLGWHQDSGRVNVEMEGNPRPRLSVKIAYFLTDTMAEDCGNFYVIPGSHRHNDYARRETGEPEGAIPIQVPAGTAVLFDRRLFHSKSPNYTDLPRKAIFYGYSYRWLRPRDNTRIEDFDDCRDPIRRQLLGASRDGHGFSSPEDDDVPLKFYLEKHGLLGPSIAP